MAEVTGAAGVTVALTDHSCCYSRHMASRAVRLVVVIYALGFLLFWPRAINLTDEALYVRAAWAFGHGHTQVEAVDGISGQSRLRLPSRYPPGTSALQAPLVRLFGSRGAPLLSLLCYCVTGLLLARWLARRGQSPIFALLFLGYLPALVLGRVAMSDVPSALVVCVMQMLLFESGPREGTPASATGSLIAGFMAGVSLLFREANVLLVAPLCIGAVVRREGRAIPLVLGGLLGFSLRLLAASIVFGHPFFTQGHRGWSIGWAVANLPLYFAALLVLAPLGLVGALAYRGPRRVEVIATVLLTFGFFLAFGYSAEESGGIKRLILGPRYFLPLVPLLSIALAESLPRLWRDRGEPGGERLARMLSVSWTAVVFLAAFLVHPALDRFGRAQREIAEALQVATSSQGVVVLDDVELDKYFGPWSNPRRLVSLRRLNPTDLPLLVARDGVTFLALLDRTDSAYHRTRSAVDEGWRAQAATHCALEVTHDAIHGSMHLRIYRIARCA